MRKFTPGPWRSDFCGTNYNIRAPLGGDFDKGSLHIAYVSGGLSEDLGNARLIAAAPELFATLKKILDGVKGGDVPMTDYVDARNLLSRIESQQ